MDLATVATLKSTLESNLYQLLAAFEKSTNQQVDSLTIVRNASGNCTSVKARVIVQLL